MLKVKLFDYSALENGSNFRINHIEFDILFKVLFYLSRLYQSSLDILQIGSYFTQDIVSIYFKVIL